MSQNYPNPFKEKTTIKYCVPYKTKVRMTIINSAGNVIEKLVDGEKMPGTYEVQFSIDKNLNEHKSYEDYLCRLEAHDLVFEKKMVFQK